MGALTHCESTTVEAAASIVVETPSNLCETVNNVSKLVARASDDDAGLGLYAGRCSEECAWNDKNAALCVAEECIAIDEIHTINVGPKRVDGAVSIREGIYECECAHGSALYDSQATIDSTNNKIVGGSCLVHIPYAIEVQVFGCAKSWVVQHYPRACASCKDSRTEPPLANILRTNERLR